MPTKLEYAFLALDAVRSKIAPNRADNKGMLGSTYAQFIERQRVGDRLRALRSHPTNIQRADPSLQNIVTYGKRAMSAGVGNCLEVSCAVAKYLASDCGFYYFDLVLFEGRDHIFVAIGQPARDRYPDHFAAWEADAAICDVWADIACPARDFPARWRARMGNWKIMGVLPCGKQATDDYWYNAVDCPKVSYNGQSG